MVAGHRPLHGIIKKIHCIIHSFFTIKRKFVDLLWITLGYKTNAFYPGVQVAVLETLINMGFKSVKLILMHAIKRREDHCVVCWQETLLHCTRQEFFDQAMHNMYAQRRRSYILFRGMLHTLQYAWYLSFKEHKSKGFKSNSRHCHGKGGPSRTFHCTWWLGKLSIMKM